MHLYRQVYPELVIDISDQAETVVMASLLDLIKGLLWGEKKKS